jgi:hypothetical protein
MGQAHLATAFPIQPKGLFGPRPKDGRTEVLDGCVNSVVRRRGKVGPWVCEMVGEVGDTIWSPAKEEAHQRAGSTGARLCRRGTTMRGDVRWWRSAAWGSGHGRSLGWRLRSASVVGGGWCRWHLHGGSGRRLGAESLEDEAPLKRRWGRQLQLAVHKVSAATPCLALQSERRLCSVDRGVAAKEQRHAAKLHEEEKVSEASPRHWEDEGRLEAAHMADDSGGAWATGTWLGSYRVCAWPATEHRLSGGCGWQAGPRPFLNFYWFSIFWILKCKTVTSLMSKICQSLQGDRMRHK